MIGFLFPGQGTQTPGMGQPWVDRPEWAIAETAAAVTGIDVPHLLTEADEFELGQTPHAQIAVTAMSLMAWKAVTEAGHEPRLVAGHSLGEYAAVIASGALSLEQGLWLVAARGYAMAQASRENPGVMMAVMGLEDDQVAICCAKADGDVWVSNHNALGQVVIAGDGQAVETAAEHAELLGGKVVPLPVEGAFHSPYMMPAKPLLVEALSRLRWSEARIPVVANVDSHPHKDASGWVNLLASHLCNPVRWRQSLGAMVSDGCEVFVTLGPAETLARFSAKTGTGALFVAVDTPDKVDSVAAALVRVKADRGPGAIGSITTLPEPPEAPGRPVGEHVHLTERLVVAPAAGVFTPAPGIHRQSEVSKGDHLGDMNGTPIVCPFNGVVADFLAEEGQRLNKHQPVVWLRPLVPVSASA